jgi:hypothetical protein
MMQRVQKCDNITTSLNSEQLLKNSEVSLIKSPTEPEKNEKATNSFVALV